MPVTQHCWPVGIKYVGFQENPPPPIYREYLRIGASRMDAVYTIR